MNSKRVKPVFLILCVILGTYFQGCTRYISADEYLKHFENNRDSYTSEFEKGAEKILVTYCPNEVYASRELVRDTSLTVQSALDNYSRSCFFVVSVFNTEHPAISPLLMKDGSTGYSDNVYKYAFSKKKDFVLAHKKDSLQSVSCKLQRSWGVSKGDALLVTFDKSKLETDISKYTLLVRDLLPQFGTLEIPLKNIVNNSIKLKRDNKNV